LGFGPVFLAIVLAAPTIITSREADDRSSPILPEFRRQKNNIRRIPELRKKFNTDIAISFYWGRLDIRWPGWSRTQRKSPASAEHARRAGWFAPAWSNQMPSLPEFAASVYPPVPEKFDDPDDLPYNDFDFASDRDAALDVLRDPVEDWPETEVLTARSNGGHPSWEG
jgi:hypothetical protein